MATAREETFGARLRRSREAEGLTQEELAGGAGLSTNAVSALERGQHRRPYPHTVRALADALGLTGIDRDAFLGAAPKRVGMAFEASAGEPVPTPPIPPTSIVGRERDAAAVESMFDGEGARLVTLTGPGGIGKTRLALEIAGEVGNRFSDGAALVALAPVSDAGPLLSTVALSLGLRETGGRSVRELVYAYLKEKRLLLVLDNFEHLLDAAPEVAALLASCPSLRILATSRTPLRVRGEQEYPLAPLAVPNPAPDVEGVLHSPAARLFVERARNANPTFELTRDNAAAVASICQRLDGCRSLVTVALADGARYGMLEPVGQYALEKLRESGEEEGTRTRHARFYGCTRITWER